MIGMLQRRRNYAQLSSNMILLIVLQVVAIILYPPEFFSSTPAPCSSAMFLLLVLSLIGMNTAIGAGIWSHGAQHDQGLNIVVRLIMLCPNLSVRHLGHPDDHAQLVAWGYRGTTWSKLDQLPLSELRFV
jgi:hypothetical protein